MSDGRLSVDEDEFVLLKVGEQKMGFVYNESCSIALLNLSTCYHSIDQITVELENKGSRYHGGNLVIGWRAGKSLIAFSTRLSLPLRQPLDCHLSVDHSYRLDLKSSRLQMNR